MDEGIWISPSGFGYSVDNLSPGIPQGLALSIIEELIHLEWNPNSESDLQYYNIYSRIYDPEPWFWTFESSTANSEYLLENTELIMEYTVTAVDHNGNESDFSNSVTNDVLNIVGNTIPEEFTLYPSFPNPFNPVTNINYTLPIGEIVIVSIFDIFGNLNDVVFEGEQVSGEYFLQWNAGEVASGIYIVQVKAGSEIRTQKILLLK